MLDAPVSGGDVGAQEGTLSIMVGGDADGARSGRARRSRRSARASRTSAPAAPARSSRRATRSSSASRWRRSARRSCSARRRASTRRAIVEALGGGLAASRVLEVRGPKLLARDFAPGFKLDLHAKDLAIVLETARELGVPLPGAALVAQLFEAERGRGHGEADNSTVVRALEALAQHEIARRPAGLNRRARRAPFDHDVQGPRTPRRCSSRTRTMNLPGASSIRSDPAGRALV